MIFLTVSCFQKQGAQCDVLAAKSEVMASFGGANGLTSRELFKTASAKARFPAFGAPDFGHNKKARLSAGFRFERKSQIFP